LHLKGTGVHVLEIIPPAAQTELHDEEAQPGLLSTPPLFAFSLGSPLGLVWRAD